MESLGPWPPLAGAGAVFLWLLRLFMHYQQTISDRYGREIARLDTELREARAVNDELRERVDRLEDDQNELRYLRRAARQAGVFNPWEPQGGQGDSP